MLSASAFPRAEPCRPRGRLAARRRRLGDRPRRVAEPRSGTRRASARRLAERLRSEVRGAGATLWEPDATIVRTDLIRAYPIDEGEPWGSWLRDLERARPSRDRDSTTTIASAPRPADAPEFWPSRLMRTRAAAADLAAAAYIGSGPCARGARRGRAGTRALRRGRSRCGRSIPLRDRMVGLVPAVVPAQLFVATIGVTAIGRWSATRLVHGVGLHPVHDARAAAYARAGIVASRCRRRSPRRIRPRRVHIPEQPLLWAALAFTLTTTMLLVEPGDDHRHRRQHRGRCRRRRSRAALDGRDPRGRQAGLGPHGVPPRGRPAGDRRRARGARSWRRPLVGCAVVAPLAGPLAAVPVGAPTVVVVDHRGRRPLDLAGAASPTAHRRPTG